MERSLQKIVYFLLVLIFSQAVYSQVSSQDEQIRLQVWADLDAFPGQFDDEVLLENADAGTKEKESEATSDFQKVFGYAINQTKKIAPYLLSGMLEGFEFEYTPYDKKRNVKEYWEFNLKNEFDFENNTIEYKNPKALNDRLMCWVYCNRTPMQKTEFEIWNSIVYPKIKGKGKGPVEKGFEGIQIACSEATKNAVREYWRKQVKNKPKEISGFLLLLGNPRVYISEGQYMVDLDFFIQTDRIFMYEHF